MEQVDPHPSLISLVAAVLQGVSLAYRLYICAACKMTVMLSRKCDRGNVYCSSCQAPQQKARVNRAQKTYKSSAQGLKIRALQSHRRRLRKKALLKNEGDRGSPSCSIKTMTPAPAIPAAFTNHGAPQNVQDSNEVGAVNSAKVPILRRDIPKITCSKCKRECLAFQKKSAGRFTAQDRERLLKWLTQFLEPVP